MLNLLRSCAEDITYYTSRLTGEVAGGVDDCHLHLVEAREVGVAVGYRF